MSYNILTETAFFKVINDLGGKMAMEQIQEEYLTVSANRYHYSA